jgi:glutaredoxin 3
MQTMRRALLIVISITAASACPRREPPAPKMEVQASALPRIVVKPRDKLLFTFATPEGTFDTATQLDKVPEGRRGWVRVVDLTIQPDRRLDHELVYVADLRAPGKDGAYPYVVMSRAAFEAAAVARAGQGATDPPPKVASEKTAGKAAGASVILYATSWCPACRSAREYLTARSIPFVEKDIEKDQGAAAELLQKAKAAGISASGVPVLEVNGTLMQGFDAERLNALLGEKR